MSRYYDDQVINEINSRVDIMDIVSETVSLTRKGNRYWGLCPFHEEKTPSFSVAPDKNLFYCFGCHAGGNIFTYIMKRDGMEFQEAVEFLAAKAGVTVNYSPRDQQNADKSRRVQEVNQAAAEYYHQYLMNENDHKGRKYLQERGITMQSLNNFMLGFSPAGWNTISNYLLKKGYQEQDIKIAGLIRNSSNNDRYFDLFRSRVIFPIYKYNGAIVGFGGRVLDDSLPKYLNTPETDLFSKRKNLYGLYQGREAARRENQVFLVEGYLDVIKMHQNGIKNCVASLGTALTSEQAALIHRYAEKVIVLYDGDEAGQRETMRAIDILQQQNLNIEVLTLPGGKDPDEYLETNEKEEFVHYIQNNKLTYLEFKINKYIESEGRIDFEARRRVIKKVQEDISKLQSEIEKNYYIKILAQKLAIEENLLYREFAGSRYNNQISIKNKSGIFRDNIEYGNYSIEEKILAAMIVDVGTYQKVKNISGKRIFRSDICQKFLDIYDDLDGDAEQKLRQMMERDDQLSATIARINYIIEDDACADDIETNSFISRRTASINSMRWKLLQNRLSTLHQKGDFLELMNFILEVEREINNTREGGRV